MTPCATTSGPYQALDDKPDDGDGQGGQAIERLAVFQIQKSQSAARNQQSTDNEQFGHKGIAYRL